METSQTTAHVVDFDTDDITQKSILLYQPEPAVLNAAYRYCRAIAANHYENFPVASWLLPSEIRSPVAAIYAFARIADDFADERQYRGHRTKKLENWQEQLKDLAPPTHPVFMALRDTITNYNLSLDPFLRLITAFKMDVHKHRYNSYNEVLHYCDHSANPVGELLLDLVDQKTPANLAASNSICTALQLTNFWQDVGIDLKKNRVYLPQDDLARFDVNVADLVDDQPHAPLKRLIHFEVDRTKQLFLDGKELGLNLTGPLAIEVRLTWLCGLEILKKIEDVHYDTITQRPTLTRWDLLKLLPTALSKMAYEAYKP